MNTERLNPVQQLIAQGVSPIVAYLTQATCGEACWEAREDVCRCSCGGRNHGCLRTPDGKRPERTRKIDGFRYVLRGIRDVCDAARRINEAHGITYVYAYSAKDYPGVPAKVKPATKDQLDKWPELKAYRDEITQAQAKASCAADWMHLWPVYTLWIREDVKDYEQYLGGGGE